MGITLEQLQEFMQDETNEQAFIDLARAAGLKTEEDIAGLQAKNSELILAMQKTKKNLAKFQNLLDSEGYQEYMAHKENPDQETSKADQELKRLQRDLQKTTEERENFQKKFASTQTRAQISAALDAQGIDPKHKNILTKSFLSDFNYDFDSDTVVIEKDGLPVTADEFFKDFANSDDGKIYLAKPENTGAGAKSFSQGRNAISRGQFDAMSQTERERAITDGVQITD